MPIHRFGTRSNSRQRQIHPPGRSITRSQNTDRGLVKNVTASITFGGGNAAGANGTFPTNSFVVGDTVEVFGAALNSGFFTVNALDGANQSFLSLDPPPKAEGPITVTIRTP
jgi:hypothetical protein